MHVWTVKFEHERAPVDVVADGIDAAVNAAIQVKLDAWGYVDRSEVTSVERGQRIDGVSS